MKLGLSLALMVLNTAGSVALGQNSPSKLDVLGIKELAYEVPHVVRAGDSENGRIPSEMDLGIARYRRELLPLEQIGGDIFVLNPHDAKPRKLVGEASHPAWSPDGLQLAYCSWTGLGFGQIEVVNADGTGQRQLTNMRGGACFPDWSPDGSKIAFTALSPGDSEKNLLAAKNTEIYVVNRNGGDSVAITAGYAARWSPGGKLLILLRRSQGKRVEGSIWIATQDGKQTKMVAVSDRAMEGAEWLPNGKGIVASYMRDGNYSVFQIFLDGSQPGGADPLKIASVVNSQWVWPAMSPDGKHLTAIVAGCAPSNGANASSQTDCSRERVVSLALDSKDEVTLAGGSSYSVVWDKQ